MNNETSNNSYEEVCNNSHKLESTLLNETKKTRLHQFWGTQPVPQTSDILPSKTVGPITTIPIENIRKEPYTLPPEYTWWICDIHNDSDVSELYELLYENYVEDDDNMFRFDYSKEFLRWALSVPGYFDDCYVGVKTRQGKLLAFISGVPATISIFQKQVKVAEINFLCIHKKLRLQRLAPVLIKEITRRMHLHGIWHAIYTAGIQITQDISKSRYYHRSLNIKKLVEINFTTLGPKVTPSIMERLYSLPEHPINSNLRPTEAKDISSILKLLENEFKSADLFPVFSIEEATHLLLPLKNVIESFVIEKEGIITDFFCFYLLPSTIIGNNKHDKAAYSYYHSSTTVGISNLIYDALILAKNMGVDVFNILDQFQHEKFLDDLKFVKGDGSLRYYVYNYLCPKIDKSKVALVMF